MTLPEPYYLDREAGIALYCGDSRDLMSELPGSRINLLMTDPPYGIDIDPQKLNKDSTFSKVKDDDVVFDPSQCLSFGRVVLWGANNYAHLIPMDSVVPDDYKPAGGWLVWDKTIDNEVKVVISHGELAWTNCFRGIRIFRHLWSGGYRASEAGLHVHPTQKPVVLFRWCLNQFTEPGDLVLDPYMGSGPLAQACFQTGRKYIGIEWEEGYCQIAKKRLEQDILIPSP